MRTCSFSGLKSAGLAVIFIGVVLILCYLSIFRQFFIAASQEAHDVDTPQISSGVQDSTLPLSGASSHNMSCASASSWLSRNVFRAKRSDSMTLIESLLHHPTDEKVMRSFLSSMCGLQLDRKGAEPAILSERKPLRSVLRSIRGTALFGEVIKKQQSVDLQNLSSGSCPANAEDVRYANRQATSSSWQELVASLPIRTSIAQLPSNFASGSYRTRFTRYPKHASWATVNHVCATCEASPSRRQFFMNPLHTCQLTLWAVGSPEPHSIRKLVSYSRKYRNALFKEREGAFQYGGQWSAITNFSHGQRIVGTGRYLDEQQETTFIVRGYFPGTTTLVPSFHVDNVGHVLHDAVWSLQITLLLGTGKLLNTTDASEKLKSQHVIMFTHEFSNVSSNFYGFLSTSLALGAVRRIHSQDHQMFRSPFSDPQYAAGDAYCFERLVVSGQDRHVDGGGSGLRDVVARSIRRSVFDDIFGLGAPSDEAADLLENHLVPRLFIYGRNDMHRRSIDNIWLLTTALAQVTKKLGLHPPQVIRTFSVTPVQQILLARRIDFFVTVQGAHLQHSLFMPDDAVVFEIAPCHSEHVSFLRRYGRYLETQRHIFFQMCDDVLINYSQDPDKVADQNLTLCEHHLTDISSRVEGGLAEMIRRRRATNVN